MPLNKRFENFVKQAPVCVMARGILERMFEPATLNQVFDDSAELGYTRAIAFSTCIQLMSEVVLNTAPSLNAAYNALQAELAEDEKFSATALYNKLNGIEPCVSEALVDYSAAQATEAIKTLGAKLHPWLPGYNARVLDGNHLASTEHRIEELRSVWDAPLPGRALVVLDPQRMVVLKAVLTENGHASERSLIDPVLESIKRRDLWIEDRNFCFHRMIWGIVRRSAYFVIRQHGQMVGELKGKPTSPTRCDTGWVSEQRLVITDPETQEKLTVRRITIQLDEPTRDGDDVMHILTNLPLKDASTVKVAELYRNRWTIEKAFNEITMTLDCEVKTMGYPRAALFAFCLALMVYNAVAVLKAALRAVHGEEVVRDKISPYYMALELSSTYRGMMIAIPEPHWAIFRRFSVKEYAATLKDVASQMNLARYPKKPRGPKKKPPERIRTTNGGNVSTFKIINAIK